MDQVSKPSVHYRAAASPDVRCATCIMFHPDTGTCDLVEGPIDGGDVCDRWEPIRPPKSKDGKPALYFDIDGVLAFQPEGSIVAVNGRFATAHLVSEATSYPWALTLPRKQLAWLDANMPVICANLAPDTRTVNLVRKAKKAGYPVCIATERGQPLYGVTKAWLGYWRIPYDVLAVTRLGGKAPLLAARGDQDAILIDDAPANEKLAGAGVQVWVPPRPWTPQGDAPDGVWRFGDLRDVKQKLGLLPRRRGVGGVHGRDPRVERRDELVTRPDVPLQRVLVNDPPVDAERHHADRLVSAAARRLDLCFGPLGEQAVDPADAYLRRGVPVRLPELREHDGSVKPGVSGTPGCDRFATSANCRFASWAGPCGGACRGKSAPRLPTTASARRREAVQGTSGGG